MSNFNPVCECDHEVQGLDLVKMLSNMSDQEEQKFKQLVQSVGSVTSAGELSLEKMNPVMEANRIAFGDDIYSFLAVDRMNDFLRENDRGYSIEDPSQTVFFPIGGRDLVPNELFLIHFSVSSAPLGKDYPTDNVIQTVILFPPSKAVNGNPTFRSGHEIEMDMVKFARDVIRSHGCITEYEEWQIETIMEMFPPRPTQGHTARDPNIN